MSEQSTELRETVRRRYAAAAVQVTEGGTGCCGPQAVEVDENFGSTLYADAERDALPAEAVAASLGCGNPTAVADLHEPKVASTRRRRGLDVCSPPARHQQGYDHDMTAGCSPALTRRGGRDNVGFSQGHHRGHPAARTGHDVVTPTASTCGPTAAVFAGMVCLAPYRRTRDVGRQRRTAPERGSYSVDRRRRRRVRLAQAVSPSDPLPPRTGQSPRPPGAGSGVLGASRTILCRPPRAPSALRTAATSSSLPPPPQGR